MSPSLTRRSRSLGEVVSRHPVLVVCGTGGVGKTTISAVLALEAALRGRRVLVMTIDPARRLAMALGISGSLNEATPVDLGQLASRAEGSSGSLDAMMLDPKHTWDGMVHRFSKDETTRNRILSNPYYQRATGSLAGSQEYMAMEKLLEVVSSGSYDLVVLDTPPTRNALDFLDAPQRMISILQEGVLGWLVPTEGRFSTARAGAILFGKGQQALFRLLERFTGAEVLSGISEFMSAFSGLLDGMRSRASQVLDLLRSDRTAFVLVASPRRLALAETLHFRDRLQEGGVGIKGLVMNRVHRGKAAEEQTEPPSTPWQAGLSIDTDDPGWTELATEVWEHYLTDHNRSQNERDNIDELKRTFPSSLPYVEVTEAEQDVHDLDALGQLLDTLQSSGS